MSEAAALPMSPDAQHIQAQPLDAQHREWTHAGLLRRLVALSWPLIVSQMIVLINGIFDTAITAHVARAELAALGVGMSIWVGVFSTLIGAVQGLGPIAAHLVGGRQESRIGHYIWQTVWIAVICSMLGMVFLCHVSAYLTLAGVPAEVASLTGEYLQVIAWGLPAALLSRIFFAVAPTLGDTTPIITINLVGVALKVPITLALVHGWLHLPRLGIIGCGIGTTVLFWSALVLSVAYLVGRRYRGVLGCAFSASWPSVSSLRELLRVGVPMALSQFMEIASFTLMSVVLARLGALVSAGHQIVTNILTVLFATPLALGVATQTLVANAIGSNQPHRAERAWRTGLATIALSSGLLSVMLAWQGAHVVAVYSDDREVQSLCFMLLPLIALYHFMDALQAVAASAMRGYQINVYPVVIYSVCLWCGGLGGGYWLAIHGWNADLLGFQVHLVGIEGMWVAAAASISACAICLTGYLALAASRRRAPALNCTAA